MNTYVINVDVEIDAFNEEVAVEEVTDLLSGLYSVVKDVKEIG